MCEGEPFGHIHSSADDFDVCARFAFAGCFQSGVEFAERFGTRGKPIGAPESVRHICIAPFCQIVVGPIGVWLQRTLHHVTVVVETENDGIRAEAAHISDLISRQLVRTFARDENCFSFEIGQRNPEGRPQFGLRAATRYCRRYLTGYIGCTRQAQEIG